MIRPGSLKPGDRIGIVSTARKTGSDALEYALSAIRRWEFVPVAGEHLLSSCNQFAGTDSERAADFQRMLDDPGISAILCARGGYGTARIIDRIDFTEFIRNPKWIIGYSDATVLHSHIQENFGIATLHASMPVNFKSNTTEALNGIKGVLEGALPSYAIGGHPLNR
ncbi:MAG: LD-carboxypeptidase, partial [Flavobacteriales bacterium]